MKLLLDSSILILSAKGSPPAGATSLIEDRAHQLYFSVAALWEITIKYGSGKLKLPVTPWELQAGLLESGYLNLNITAPHVNQLPALREIHRDPFDRIMVAQAIVEGMLLVTTDATLSGYGDMVKQV
ncbi:MAG: type II toxin-antitoxin system VapC family toxin [Bifidobacteriaceae bacterium]|jgi:PIN domain nuclease of toxin-antitoxin system|nr:type II toxin-antitoxin system VapC family toxin [Bifidobacteriaceae bacterium]